ncbi:MAG: ammonium transporter family protein, partial [Eubacteriales bacterium]|nr:ammonium transporter family protein [Eubacteriales bacterium]
TAPGYSIANAAGTQIKGLFYGGGFELLGLQLLGFGAVALWTAATITITFIVIRKTVGLRVTEEEEILGLDVSEHGLPSAYADFSIMNVNGAAAGMTPVLPKAAAPVEAAVPVELRTAPTASAGPKMSKVVIMTKQSMFERLKDAMDAIGVTGMTVTQVLGCGMQKGRPEYYRGVEMETSLLPKIEVEIVVCKIPVRTVIEAAKSALYTGHIGDGKIFVYNVESVVKVRTGEEDYDALQDVE